MSLFSPKNPEELILILDVQSSIVRGSLALIKEGVLPNIIFTYNANIPWKPHTDSNYLIKMTLRAVSETLDACLRGLHLMRASDRVPKKVNAIHFALSSPWIVSRAQTLTTSFSKDTIVTKAHVERVIEEERAKLQPTDNAEVATIEQKIFDVRLNGYSVANWMGKTARSIDVSYTISLAGSRMIERFREACAHAARKSQVFFHSSLLLQFIGMRICMPDRGTYALVHAHGELTDVAVMDNHSCIFFGSFPFGVRTLTRKIAASADIDLQAADSVLTLYVGGHFDSTHGAGQAEAVHDISAGWSAEVKKLFISQPRNSSTTPLEHSHFIISSTAHDDLFVHCLRDLYPKATVELLSIDNILPHATYSGHAERRRLTGLYAVAIGSMKGL